MKQTFISPTYTSPAGKYKFGDYLGHGSFATVHRVYDPATDKMLAIKVRPKVYNGKDARDKVNREISTWINLLDVPRTTPLYEVLEDQHNAYMVMKELKHSLLHIVQDKTPLSEAQARKVLLQIIPWLQEVHNRGYIYGDMKAQNVMFSRKGLSSLYMIDFGCTTMKQDASLPNPKRVQFITGTLPYMAPEIFLRKYDERVDIWSLGILLIYMMSGRYLFHAPGEKLTFEQYMTRTLTCDTDPILEDPNVFRFSKEAKDLLIRMLQFSASDRITLEECLDHPFLQKPSNV